VICNLDKSYGLILHLSIFLIFFCFLIICYFVSRETLAARVFYSFSGLRGEGACLPNPLFFFLRFFFSAFFPYCFRPSTEQWAAIAYSLSVSLYETKRWKVIFSNPSEDLEGWGFQSIGGLIWVRCQRPPSGKKVFWLGLQGDCFWSQIYDSLSISKCQAPLQGVCRRPPPPSYAGLFSRPLVQWSLVCTCKQALLTRRCVLVKPWRIGER
jgi:hypothetical protein